MTKRLLFSLLIVVIVFSCKTEKQLTFSEVEITTDNNTVVEIFIPKAHGLESSSATINQEIENFVASILIIGGPDDENKPSSITTQIDAFNASYQEFLNDFPETSQTWEAQIDGEVTFHSEELISIAITSYLNTGGAHGITTISFLNFDASTGKRLKNETIFTNIVAFKAVAKQYFNKEVADKFELFEPESFSLPANIGFSDEGVILLYNTYEIAPYAFGITEFTIPFKDVNKYLTFNSL